MKGFAASSHCLSPVSCTSESSSVAGSAASSARRSSVFSPDVSGSKSGIVSCPPFCPFPTLPGCRRNAKRFCRLDVSANSAANARLMNATELQKVADWLIDGARSATSPTRLMAETCERLVAAGLPLWRVAVFVRTLHPDIFGRAFFWRPGAEVVVNPAGYETPDSPEYQTQPAGDPVRQGTGGPVSHRRSREQALPVPRRHARRGRHRLYRVAAAVHRRLDPCIELDHEAGGRL